MKMKIRLDYSEEDLGVIYNGDEPWSQRKKELIQEIYLKYLQVVTCDKYITTHFVQNARHSANWFSHILKDKKEYYDVSIEGTLVSDRLDINKSSQSIIDMLLSNGDKSSNIVNMNDICDLLKKRPLHYNSFSAALSAYGMFCTHELNEEHLGNLYEVFEGSMKAMERSTAQMPEVLQHLIDWRATPLVMQLMDNKMFTDRLEKFFSVVEKRFKEENSYIKYKQFLLPGHQKGLPIFELTNDSGKVTDLMSFDINMKNAVLTIPANVLNVVMYSMMRLTEAQSFGSQEDSFNFQMVLLAGTDEVKQLSKVKVSKRDLGIAELMNIDMKPCIVSMKALLSVDGSDKEVVFKNLEKSFWDVVNFMTELPIDEQLKMVRNPRALMAGLSEQQMKSDLEKIDMVSSDSVKRKLRKF